MIKTAHIPCDPYSTLYRLRLTSDNTLMTPRNFYGVIIRRQAKRMISSKIRYDLLQDG